MEHKVYIRDKVFSEYSCKLLNSSLSNSLKLDHKNTENKEVVNSSK